MIHQEDNWNFKNAFKLWYKHFKQNKLRTISQLFLFLFQIFVVKSSFVDLLNKHFIIFLIILVIAYLFVEVLNLKDIQETESLKNELQIKNKAIGKLEASVDYLGLILSDLPKDFLIAVSKYLNLTNSERISLFNFNETHFRIIGRYSENPSYDPINRKEFPINQGYIAKCFENNDGKPYFYKDNLPKGDTKSYSKQVKKDTNMDDETIKNLSMKSRAYFARLVKDDKNNNVGILMIESVNERLNYDPQELNSKIEYIIIPHVQTMLEISNKLKEDKCHEN